MTPNQPPLKIPVSATAPYKCDTCKSTSVNQRNLAVFIDGTSNKPGNQNTNVVKLRTDVDLSPPTDRKPEQCTHYVHVIGAHNVGRLSLLGRAQKKISSGFEMAFAWNFGENVKEAYRWLVSTYREGDRIYLFGFSRGAYQARALASMIHEVGLVTAVESCEKAYELYLSIDPYKLQQRSPISQFRSASCWEGVRVHFIGVWDTVSSLGLVKKKVHITASASVINACHFRHALALDERRVKFLPEYFREMNGYHGSAVDVKECWFAGSHSDVGGSSYEQHPLEASLQVDDSGFFTNNVPLEWMRNEAAANGLFFVARDSQPEDINPDSADTGKSMTPWWKIPEFLPILHQVSFRGTGEHKRRPHLCRPRSILPGKQIHPFVFSADAYTSYATLENSARVPFVPRGPSNLPDTTGPLDEQDGIGTLESLLGDPQTTLNSLERVLSLIDPSGTNPSLGWSLSDLQDPPRPVVRYAYAIIYDAISTNPVVSEEFLNGEADTLCTTLQSHPDHPEFAQALYILRFSAKHSRLRQRFVDGNIIKALMVALERTAERPSEILFPLVVDSLCYIISDEMLRSNVVNWFGPPAARRIQKGLSLILSVKAPIHLMASLKLVASLVEHDSGHRESFKTGLYELAKKERDGIGLAAVKALVAVKAPSEKMTRDAHICNILGYLGDLLPPLDVEGVSSPSPDNTPAELGNTHPPVGVKGVSSASHDNTDELPSILRVGGEHSASETSRTLNRELMDKLVSTIESCNAHERTAATLTLMKLCKYSKIREFCTQNMVLDIFVKQLKQEKTSLLAAYALRKCLEYSSEIFYGLMASADLRDRVMDFRIVSTLIKTLAGGERDRTRMGLVCIDILDKLHEELPLDLTPYVRDSIACLKSEDRNVRMKGVKTISALAQTAAGEEALKKHVEDIIRKLPPKSSEVSRSQIVGASAVVYNLSKNDALHKYIRDSQAFKDWKAGRPNSVSQPC